MATARIGARKGARLCIRLADRIAKVARLAWSDADASIYVIPYPGPAKTSFAGVYESRLGSTTLPFEGQLEAVGGDTPKVSIHESGICHAQLGAERSGRARGPRLHHGTGHIATIQTFRPDLLPTLATPPSSQGPVIDVVATPPSTPWTSLRFVLSVIDPASHPLNGPWAVLNLARAKGTDLHIRIASVSDYEPHNDGEGVVVLAGWGVSADVSAAALEFVFAVAR